MDKEESAKQYRIEEKPILEDLEKIGVVTDDMYFYLPRHKEDWKKASPILIKWLPFIKHPPLIEATIRLLSVPWLRGHEVGKALMEMASDPSLHPSLRWVIGNTIEVIADDQIYNEIVDLIKIQSFGTSRQMFVVALGNMKNPLAVPELVKLLDDDEVNGHAIMALNKLKAIETIEDVRKMTNYPRTWVRNEAKKTVAKFEKIIAKRNLS